MGHYATAQICLNGHVITGAVGEGFDSAFCPHCGENTITNCQHCQAPIKGYYLSDYPIIGLPYDKSSFCDSCGKPYPWTERGQQAAYALIEFSELDEEEKKDFKESISALSIDTPGTPLAIAKFKKYAKKASSEVGSGLKTLMIELVSETVKKAIWPS
jgi:hypothetical protein